jgi:hypothetical protein
MAALAATVAKVDHLALLVVVVLAVQEELAPRAVTAVPSLCRMAKMAASELTACKLTLAMADPELRAALVVQVVVPGLRTEQAEQVALELQQVMVAPSHSPNSALDSWSPMGLLLRVGSVERVAVVAKAVVPEPEHLVEEVTVVILAAVGRSHSMSVPPKQ